MRVGTQGLFNPILENFRPVLPPYPTDCPWVSEDRISRVPRMTKMSRMTGMVEMTRITGMTWVNRMTGVTRLIELNYIKCDILGWLG